MTRPKVMCRVSVGDQEKCGPDAMAVENGKRRLKLASKTIIESKRNYRLHGSTILTLSHVNVALITTPPKFLDHPGPATCQACHEIVMVARSERIIREQNGSSRSFCNPLRRGIEWKIFITVQNPLVYC